LLGAEKERLGAVGAVVSTLTVALAVEVALLPTLSVIV
jgi:hypothetical protein